MDLGTYAISVAVNALKEKGYSSREAFAILVKAVLRRIGK